MLDKINNTSYSIAVDLLVNAISGLNTETPNLYQQATEYFRNEPANKQNLLTLTAEIEDTKTLLKTATAKNAKELTLKLEQQNKKLQSELNYQKSARLRRLNAAIEVCLEILSLSEGDDFNETQFKSSKFLTTLVLFSPEENKKLAELHHSLKPAYKAVLSLRLLDKLVSEGVIKNAYILKNFALHKRYESYETTQECYAQSVILPVMLAAMFQDVGLQHPRLTELLEGKDGKKDRFRLLDQKEREEMLALNYQYTIDYLENGLGCQQAGALQENEVSKFENAEQKRLKFQLSLVLDANSSKKGTSEIIKIPQIYTSVIFSTKREYERKNLPTASILITQLGVKDVISPKVAETFVKIVGQFPLGYGIAYIAQDMGGNELNYFEYAIVSRLNPPASELPICRLVTKKLLYIPQGKTVVVKKQHNLHFPIARKKLVKIDPKRLDDLMEKLTHNYDATTNKSFVPYFWEPHDYFMIRGNQNLWSVKK